MRNSHQVMPSVLTCNWKVPSCDQRVRRLNEVLRVSTLYLPGLERSKVHARDLDVREFVRHVDGPEGGFEKSP